MTKEERLEFIKRLARPVRRRKEYVRVSATPVSRPPQPTREQRARGIRHGKAKLCDSVVRRIRQLRGAGWAYREVAAIIGVGTSTVTNVLRGKTWGHVR